MTNLDQILNDKVISNRSVGGGCIADSRIIETKSGKKYFIKSYSGTGGSILRNEANGLKELSKANAIQVPKVFHFDEDILILQYIQSGNKARNFSELFGRQFAQMHRFTSDKFGFFEDNFIGSTQQKNLPLTDNWADFYWRNRLLFQFQLAEKNGYIDQSFHSIITQFEKRIYELIKDSEEKPCVLHGDLWGGNYMVDESGKPVLIDPAVYYGHREADLGMTQLFGGFDSKFYHAYNEAYPLPYGWKERIDIYKLYHVINHLNLFGSGYYSQMSSIIRKYL